MILQHIKAWKYVSSVQSLLLSSDFISEQRGSKLEKAVTQINLIHNYSVFFFSQWNPGLNFIYQIHSAIKFNLVICRHSVSLRYNFNQSTLFKTKLLALWCACAGVSDITPTPLITVQQVALSTPRKCVPYVINTWQNFVTRPNMGNAGFL